MSQERHLVTGGSGVLGRALLRELLDHGKRARVLDLRPPPSELAAEVEFIEGSVLDPAAVDRAVKDMEVVYHLAASMPQAPLDARGFWEINVGGTLLAAAAAIRHQVRRLVFASTIEIYGLYYPQEFPVCEDSEKRFTGIYSRNKLECEERLLELSRERGLEVAFPRMPMIFGPGFYHEASMKTLFRLISLGLPVPVAAHPRAPWASVSARDAAQGLRLCAEVPAANGEAFNLAAADAPACEDALRELIRRVGSRSRLVKIPVRLLEWAVDLNERWDFLPTPAELVRFSLTGGIYSIEKAWRVLAYEPQDSAVAAMESAYRHRHPQKC